MSLMELFRNYSKGNHGNPINVERATARSHAIQGGNPSNHGNTGNTRLEIKTEVVFYDPEHKAEIVTELHDAEIRAKLTTDAILSKFVTCYTPNGKPIEIEARDAEHADFLISMNPRRPNYE